MERGFLRTGGLNMRGLSESIVCVYESFLKGFFILACLLRVFFLED